MRTLHTGTLKGAHGGTQHFAATCFIIFFSVFVRNIQQQHTCLSVSHILLFFFARNRANIGTKRPSHRTCNLAYDTMIGVFFFWDDTILDWEYTARERASSNERFAKGHRMGL